MHKTVLADRQLLLEKFRAGRLDSIALLLDSIDRRRDIPLLLPAERLLLYYWIERYHAIDSLAFHFNEVCMEAASNRPTDHLTNCLEFHSLENIDLLVSWIDQSGCDDGKFRFRVQLLETMLRGDWEDQATVNREISAFVSRFLRDEEKFRQKIKQTESQRFKTKNPDEPWTLEFGMGFGFASVSGNIAEYLSTRTVLSFNFNVYYNSFYASFMMQPIFAKLKRDIPANHANVVWEADNPAIIGNYGLAFGVSCIDNEFLKMNAFIGLSSSNCSPTEQQISNNEALRSAGIYGGIAPMFGIDATFRLYNMMDNLKRNDFPVSFNMRLNYIPSIFSNANYQGNMFLMTFGISIELAGW